MVTVGELLDLKDRKLYLMKDGAKIPMGIHFYIADNTVFFKIDRDSKVVHTLEDLRNALEIEALDKCWSTDIYVAPMQQLSSCEIKFPKDFYKTITDDIFDDCYTITKMDITYNDIIIHLK